MRAVLGMWRGTRAPGFPVGVVAVTLLALAGCATPAPKPPEQARSDAATAERVLAALNADPIYFFKHVDVTANGGVVQLTGFVWTPDAIYQAKRIARSVPGVTRVQNRMDLARPALRGGGGG